MDRLASWTRDSASGLGSVVFIAAVAAVAATAQNLALAVYALGFWHYLLYGLAYRYGAVPLPVFKRDAVLMKTVALALGAWVYLQAPLDLLSLAVVLSGFLLNALGARALGSDRTYYGYELADIPHQHVTRFPFSWVAHPMLLGNVVAYGGTLLNADFRAHWWPLAGAHVALNAGLLVMELAVEPKRLAARGATEFSLRGEIGAAIFCVSLGAAAGALAGWQAGPPAGACIGACVAAYAYSMYRCYSIPRLTFGI